jgi:hypothetical protein
MAGAAPKYPQPGKPYGGWTPNQPTLTQKRVGLFFGVVTWLWVFHRARNDLPHMLVCYTIRALCCTPSPTCGTAFNIPHGCWSVAFMSLTLAVMFFVCLGKRELANNLHVAIEYLQGWEHPWDHAHDASRDDKVHQ